MGTIGAYATPAGMSRAQQGYHKEAVDWFKKALKIAPDYLPALLEAGLLLQRMQRPEEGLGLLTAAL